MLEKDYLVNEELMHFLSNNLIRTSRDNLIEINLNTNTFDKINQINNIWHHQKRPEVRQNCQLY